MRKNLLLGGALLFCSLMTFTSCDQVFSNLDNPVSSYLELPETSITIYRGQSHKIEYKTISDAKPVFKSADEKIAIVDPETGVVTGANAGTTKITVELPATPVYNADTKEFTVTVDALLSLAETEKEIAPGEPYKIGVSTKSDGKITYKSSNEKVATVDNAGNVTAVACGDATITVSIAATPAFNRTETAEFAAKVRIFNFAQLKAATVNSEDTEITAYLADNTVIDLTGELKLTGKKVQILGNKEKPATIKVTGKSITIDGGFKLANVNVDGTGQTASFIKGYKQSSGETLTKVTSGQYVIKEPIVLEGIKATNMVKAFFDCNSTAYVYETLTINDCLVHYANQGNVVLNLASAMAVNFNITNSTFWATTSGANFIALSGKRPWEVTGYESETGKLTCANNTFYNIAKSKQFLNTNTLKGQKYLYVMNSNIFVDSSNKKIYGNMTNNKNQLTTDGKNTYYYNGAFFAETNYNGDAGLQTDPGFKDATNGDFTVSGAEQVANQTGDPRWLK